MKIKKIKVLTFFFMSLLLLYSCDSSTNPPPEEKPPGYQEDIPWTSLADSPWPMYHHDPQSTGRTKYLGPREGVVEWSIDSYYVRGGISVNADSSINFVSSIYNRGIVNVAINGQINWIHEVEYSSWAATTPIVAADGTIYVGNFLTALNPDGTIKWKLDLPYIRNVGMVLDKKGNIYFVANNSTLYSISPQGEINWEMHDERFYGTEASALLFSPDGKTIYVKGLNPALFAIDIETQKILWSFGTILSKGLTELVDSQGNIYLITSDANYNNGNTALFSLNPNGEVRWFYDYYHTGIYGLTMDWNGNIYLADDSLHSYDYSGNLRWKKDLGGPSYSPLVTDGENIIYVLVGWNIEKCIGFNDQGNIVFEAEIGSEESTGYSPAIGYDRSMFIPTFKGRKIYKIK